MPAPVACGVAMVAGPQSTVATSGCSSGVIASTSPTDSAAI
jgi:hypothetical protein